MRPRASAGTTRQRDASLRGARPGSASPLPHRRGGKRLCERRCRGLLLHAVRRARDAEIDAGAAARVRCRSTRRPAPTSRPPHDVVVAEHTRSGTNPPASPTTRSTPPRWPSRAASRRASPARTPAPSVITTSTPSTAAASTVGNCCASTQGTLNTRSSAIPHSAAADNPKLGPTLTSPVHDPACDGPTASASAVDHAASPWQPTTEPRRKPPSGNTSASAGCTGSTRSRARASGRTRSANLCVSATRAASRAPEARS